MKWYPPWVVLVIWAIITIGIFTFTLWAIQPH